MAQLIVKSPYIKAGGKRSAGGYVKYIATREGVEMAEDTSRHLPATAEQQQMVDRAIKQHPDMKDIHEYEDYRSSPTRGNADAFLRSVYEQYEDGTRRDVYLRYIDERPGSNGLFTDEGVPIVLSQVQKEMNDHPGNIWTHIISLRREDAERLGYNNPNAWMHLLRSHRNMIAQQMKIAPEKTNDQYVFPSPNGGPISPDSVNNMLKRVLERAGIPKVRFHDLRHTFATIALQNGVDIKTVSGMLGHFSAGFTLDTYAHVTTSAQKEAAQTMGALLG